MKKLLFSVLLILIPNLCFGEVVKEVQIEGLKWTKKRFVLRELLFKSGDEFSERKLKESIRNLLNTHLFYEIRPVVKRTKDGVIVKLKIKERFPIVPLPKLRLKSSGSYRAGMEVRDYNLLGMGHRLYTGYVKWFNTSSESYSVFTYVDLYRVIENRGNIYGGIYYSSEEESSESESYRVKKIDLPFGVHFFLDERKISQIRFGITPSFSRYTDVLSDKKIYYANLSYTRDLSTDMVYFVKGGIFNVSINQAVPKVSDLTTGRVDFSFSRSVQVAGTETRNYWLGMGTKLGYSGKEYKIVAPVPGYRSRLTESKRYIAGSYGIRAPIIDKSIYFFPKVYLGNTFKGTDGILLSAGFEVTAFWAKLTDGIIRFKIFRGLGRDGDTQTLLKLTFRW
jgi:outer membrane protein assembly factor BamA